MVNYQIKIYVASEEDTPETIMEKFQIDKVLFYILNPMVKNKKSITNIPLKIPYFEEEERMKVIDKPIEIIKNIIPNNNYLNILSWYIKEFIILNTINTSLALEHKIIIRKELNKLNNENLSSYIECLISFIEKYESLNKETYIENINEIDKYIKKINNKKITSFNNTLLLYTSYIKNKDYKKGEELFYNYINSI